MKYPGLASRCHNWPLRDLAGLSHFIAIHEYDTFYVINRPTMVQFSENTNVIILVVNNISRYFFVWYLVFFVCQLTLRFDIPIFKGFIFDIYREMLKSKMGQEERLGITVE